MVSFICISLNWTNERYNYQLTTYSYQEWKWNENTKIDKWKKNIRKWINSLKVGGGPIDRKMRKSRLRWFAHV